jgi:hypothetical protein
MVGLLVPFAGVVLLFTGRYPKPLYAFAWARQLGPRRFAQLRKLLLDLNQPI